MEKINILLVDDRLDNFTVLEAVLDSPNYNLVRATSGFEAVALAAKMQFAVILLDVQMPGKNGFETAKEIRVQGASKDAPIIFVTAIYGDEAYVNLGYEAGAVDYIFKPFSADILRSKVSVFVDLFIKTQKLIYQSEQLRELENREHASKLLELRIQSIQREHELQQKYITSIKETEQSQRFLAEAGACLATSTLDYNKTLSKIAALAVPRFGTWCAVHRIEENGEIKQVALNHENSEEAHFDVQSMPDVIRTGKSELVSLTETDSDTLGVRSYMCVPMLTRDKTIGTITLASTKKNYKKSDLEVIEELARRAAMAIENALLYTKAEMAIRTRDEFLSIASHELRTPLTPLKMQFQSMTKLINDGRFEMFTPERIKKILQMSDRQLDRLNNLIEELLSVSTINMGRLTLDYDLLDLSELIRNVAEQYKSQLEASSCKLSLELDPSIKGRWDASKLEQVLINLLTNAIKYGHGKPICIRAVNKDNIANICIQDHGIGIDPEAQNKIFELFERAPSAKNYGGLGLGLYVVRNIINGHGGTINVESKLGQGSTFVVEIPKTPEITPLKASLH